MTHIQGGNGIKAAENYMSMGDIMAKQNSQANISIGDMDDFEAAKSIRYDKSVKSGMPQTVMGNFNEYMQDMQDKAKAEGENAASDEHEKNQEAREVARNISSEERKQLAQLGIDVDSMDLSDLMSLVNNLRSEAHKQELTELLAMAQINQGDMDSLMMTSSGVSVAGTDVSLANVNVADVLIQKSETENSQKDVNGEQIPITDKEFLYLERNHLPVNQENLYKAHFSGQKVEETELPQDMMEQLQKVVAQAGYEEDATAMEGAKLLFANDMPVTTDAVRDYMQFKSYEGMNIQDVPEKSQTVVAQNMATELGQKLYQEVKQVSTLAVYDMVQAGKAVTIASARTYTVNNQENYKDAEFVAKRLSEVAESQDIGAVSAMRQMEEIRLMMTESVATRMMRLDINIDTRELSQVVADLKAVEKQLTLEAFQREGVAPTEDNLFTYQEMQNKVQEIGEAPAHNLGLLMKGTGFTINSFHAEISVQMESSESGVQVSQSSFEAIRRSYEAVGTAPRRDMGDSITKAFGNAADMLQEMEIPATEENLRGVRILGYNSIEITEENLREIVNYDRQVNDLMDAFYPEAVLSMIKDGINPMDVPIDELNHMIRSKNYNGGVTEAKNFASYLRDMEKQGELTKEERESYIGMYRFMDKLSKSGDREAGFLFANGSRLTVKNLLAAMRSRKATGLDVSVDDDFGLLTDMETKGKAIDAQIESAFANTAADETGEMLSYEQWESLLNDETIATYMEEQGIAMTAINAQAVSLMVGENQSFYDLVADVMSKLRFEDHNKEDMIDQETGNMAASLSGAEIGIDFPMENLLEQLRGSEQMALTYEDLRNQLMERMYVGGVEGAISSADLASIKLVQAGFHVLGQMARNDHYQMPVATKSGVQLVNLTVKHSEENQGGVEIRMPHETFGDLEAKLQLGADGSLSGYVVSSTSEANIQLAETQDTVKEMLLEKGFSAVDISVGQIAVSGQSVNSGVSGKTMDIYETAVTLVKAFASL